MNIIFEDKEHIDPNGTKWHLIVYDTVVLDLDGQLVNAHSLVYVPTDEELAQMEAEKEKADLIANLENDIRYKKLLDMDCTAEQEELIQLLEFYTQI